MKLDLSNATPLQLVLVVNGKVVDGPLGNGLHEFPASRLPPLPWTVEVRAPAGRKLLGLTVRAGDVSSKPTTNGGIEMRGAGARIDLSCGRIDVYSGPPLMGPVPGHGLPGDCDS
jgi:hypothetical protein